MRCLKTKDASVNFNVMLIKNFGNPESYWTDSIFSKLGAAKTPTQTKKAPAEKGTDCSSIELVKCIWNFRLFQNKN